jgi:Dolichyl-phosphate-mannose-protein mannosyltransferase
MEDSRAVLTDGDTAGSRRPAMIAALVLIAATALLYVLAHDARLGYDTTYQLVWGRDLFDGRLPHYDIRLAPTPHPLQVLVAAPLSVLGQGADEAMRVLSLLSLALLALGLYRVGALLFSRPVGALAAVLLITRPHLIELAYLGDADVPAVALVAWAATLELARPRRWAAVLALLALAGLLRPEAWLLSAAYLVWLGWGRHPRALALPALLAAAGPLLWALSDLAVTGDPLWSLHHTRTGTELLERPTGAVEAVEQLPRHVNFLLGAPALAVGLIGFAAGLVAARHRMRGLVAVLVLTGGGFLALALAGLSLQPRYLAGVAAGIAVCAAVGGLGWLVLDRDHRWRGPWRIAGIAGIVLVLAGLPFDAARYADVRDRVVDDGRLLEQLARGDARAALRGCGPVSVPTIRPIPYLALWSETSPAAYVEAGAAPAPAGTFVTPTPGSRSWAGGGGDGQPPRVLPPVPPGYRPAAGNAAWSVLVACS